MGIQEINGIPGFDKIFIKIIIKVLSAESAMINSFQCRKNANPARGTPRGTPGVPPGSPEVPPGHPVETPGAPSKV